MYRLPPLLPLLVVAGLLGACSDRGSVTPPAAAPASARASNGQSGHDDGARSFSTIDVPGATSTLALDINSRGEIVGRYVLSGKTHGFLRSAIGAWTTIDFPGADFTVAAGINAGGDIAGWYALPAAPTRRHGYVLHGGVFTSFDPPGSNFTNALGINDEGEIVGRYCTLQVCRMPGSGDFHGFLRSDDGKFTTIDVPGSRETNAWKINNRGQIGGAWGDVSGTNHLFVLRNGQYTKLDLPGGRPVTQNNGGMNPRGDLLGLYCDVGPCNAITGTGAHGFLLDEQDLTTIDYPGASATGAFAMNARGDIVGTYFDAAAKNHGFLLTGANGEESGNHD